MGLHNNLTEQSIIGMKDVSKMLMKYSYPLSPVDVEDDVYVLKEKCFDIDGYPINIHLSRADYSYFEIEILQISSKISPFLPFNVVCKIAKKFFPGLFLSYFDFFEKNYKTYTWIARSKDGEHIITEGEMLLGSYCGYEFELVDVKLFR